MKLKFVVAFFLFVEVSLSQQEAATNWGLSLGGGVAISSHRHQFTASPSVVVGPGFSLSASISYERVRFVEPTILQFHLEATHSHLTTGRVENPPGSAELKWNNTNLIFCSRFAVEGRFTPFVQIGVGVGRIGFDKKYTHEPSQNAAGSSVGLCLGAQGGLSFRVSSSIRLEVYVEKIQLMKEIAIGSDPMEGVLHSPSVTVVGVRLGHLF